MIALVGLDESRGRFTHSVEGPALTACLSYHSMTEIYNNIQFLNIFHRRLLSRFPIPTPRLCKDCREERLK